MGDIMKIVTEEQIALNKDTLKNCLDRLHTDTNILDNDDRKRTNNYFEWLHKKTNIVNNEKTFVCNEILQNLKRGDVVWIEFGFNIGYEFGGRHPAIILRKTGDSIFVVPVSSQEPYEKKDYHVRVEKIYNFKNMIRWANVLKIQNVSIQRVDFKASIGNVKGHILNEINDAIKISHIF